jgi:hypothetical protein
MSDDGQGRDGGQGTGSRPSETIALVPAEPQRLSELAEWVARQFSDSGSGYQEHGQFTRILWQSATMPQTLDAIAYAEGVEKPDRGAKNVMLSVSEAFEVV